MVLVIAAASWVLVASQPPPGGGNVLEVCAEGCPYTSIADAVAAAARGDTILIHPGTYKESLLITKGITLRGMDRDKVILQAGEKYKPVIHILTRGQLADGLVRIEGLTIQACCRGEYPYSRPMLM